MARLGLETEIVDHAVYARWVQRFRKECVVCSKDGEPLTQRLVQGLVHRAARRANIKNVGVPILRHTF